MIECLRVDGLVNLEFEGVADDPRYTDVFWVSHRTEQELSEELRLTGKFHPITDDTQIVPHEILIIDSSRIWWS